MNRFITPRLNLFFSAATFWLASNQSVSAQTLIAQSGAAKTAVGWAIVLLCIGLGLLLVCRPSVRNPIEKKRFKKAK